MNKYSFSFLFIVLFIFFLSSCNTNKKNENVSENDSAACANPDDVNPNGSSELAVLMREMVVFSDSLKSALITDTLISFPENFKKIHTATPTDSTVVGDVFTGHAELYLNALHKLYDEPKENRKENYNNLISSCVSCHENFCRGPIKRINKMRIDLTASSK